MLPYAICMHSLTLYYAVHVTLGSLPSTHILGLHPNMSSTFASDTLITCWHRQSWSHSDMLVDILPFTLPFYRTLYFNKYQLPFTLTRLQDFLHEYMSSPVYSDTLKDLLHQFKWNSFYSDSLQDLFYQHMSSLIYPNIRLNLLCILLWYKYICLQSI